MTGGSFYRSYDGVTFTDESFPATVSDFRFDRFEVTVGRFRKFVAAWRDGWRPAAGAGKHTHLNAGRGLIDSSGSDGPPDSSRFINFEQGWDTSWAANVAPTDANLRCSPSYPHSTWTPTPGANENQPINCVNWWEAYAFCTWDGGFLPSEAEWNYAASGGSEQRLYPWSSPPSSSSIDCSYANFDDGTVDEASYCVPSTSDGGTTGSTNDVGSESPKGDGKYGQADLAGNVTEFTLDAYPCGPICSPFDMAPCEDCFSGGPSYERVARGGAFMQRAPMLLSSSRYSGGPPSFEYGIRCARPGGSTDGHDPIVPECSGKNEGDLVCHGMDRVRCGKALETTTLVDTCSAAESTCVAAACVACESGKGNCDSNATDCETDLNSTSTCGTNCNDAITCSSANGAASCIHGSCGMSACEPGYGDCVRGNDGCETSFGSASTCGTSCQNLVTCKWPTPACVANACAAPPSCNGLAADCGGASNESCCAAPLVAGGTFYTNYDGVNYTMKTSPVSVDDFRLDKFEITVGRFRNFVAAWNAGWRPGVGDGKRADVLFAGWDPKWNTNVAPTDSNLLSCGTASTWTSATGTNERRPINCIGLFEAEAFCLWDGGYLASTFESNYAGSGGSEQRVYPWSVPPSSENIDCSYAVYDPGTPCAGSLPVDVGSRSPKGDGKYGQADLAGNVSEWTMFGGPSGLLQGGNFSDDAPYLRSALTLRADAERDFGYGARCARTP